MRIALNSLINDFTWLKQSNSSYLRLCLNTLEHIIQCQKLRQKLINNQGRALLNSLERLKKMLGFRIKSLKFNGEQCF